LNYQFIVLGFSEHSESLIALQGVNCPLLIPHLSAWGTSQQPPKDHLGKKQKIPIKPSSCLGSKWGQSYTRSMSMLLKSCIPLTLCQIFLIISFPRNSKQKYLAGYI